jgi:hypothetical protein
MFGLFKRSSGGGGKPSLDAVHFDTTGYAAQGEPQPGKVLVWHTPEGDGLGVYFFPVRPDRTVRDALASSRRRPCCRPTGAGGALRLCPLHSHRPPFKSRAVPPSVSSAPPHPRFQALLRRLSRLQGDPCRGSGRRRYGGGWGGGWSGAGRMSPTSRLSSRLSLQLCPHCISSASKGVKVSGIFARGPGFDF